MGLTDLLPSCEKLGHPKARANLIVHHLWDSYETDCYCPDCDKPFTRPATLEEIREFNRIQSIPLTEYCT